MSSDSQLITHISRRQLEKRLSEAIKDIRDKSNNFRKCLDPHDLSQYVFRKEGGLKEAVEIFESLKSDLSGSLDDVELFIKEFRRRRSLEFAKEMAEGSNGISVAIG